MTEPDFTLLAEFLGSRSGWLAVGVIPAMDGRSGFDIAMRLDGCYCDTFIHGEIAAVMSRRLHNALVAAQIVPPTPTRSFTLVNPKVVRCKVRHRPLRNEESRADGVGPICKRRLARRQHDHNIEEST